MNNGDNSCVYHNVTTKLMSYVVCLYLCVMVVGVTALTCRWPSVLLRAVAAAVGGLTNPQTPSSGQPVTQWGNMTCFQQATQIKLPNTSSTLNQHQHYHWPSLHAFHLQVYILVYIGITFTTIGIFFDTCNQNILNNAHSFPTLLGKILLVLALYFNKVTFHSCYNTVCSSVQC